MNLLNIIDLEKHCIKYGLYDHENPEKKVMLFQNCVIYAWKL